MDDFSHNPKLMREGRERLRRLVERFRKQPADGDAYTAQPMSGLATAQAPHVRIDNVEAVVVHRADNGGWYADILFKEVPYGVAQIMGTPYATPHRTRGRAEEEAYRLVMMVFSLESQFKSGRIKVTEPVFRYGGIELPLSGELLEAMSNSKSQGYGSAARAYERLDEITAELFCDGITLEVLNKLAEHQYARLLSVVHMSVEVGIMSYPRDPMQAPSDNHPLPDIEGILGNKTRN